MIRALAELPAGTARGLLADVTRLARPIFARLTREGDARGQKPLLHELVGSACVAAADLAMLDDNLARFERERARATAPVPTGSTRSPGASAPGMPWCSGCSRRWRSSADSRVRRPPPCWPRTGRVAR